MNNSETDKKEKIEVLGPKEKADALRALCEGSFKRRNELEALEWKMNFSLWTGIVLAAWALHNKPEHLGAWSLSFGLVILLHFYIVRKFNVSEQQAVSFAMVYLGELEKLIGFEQKPSDGEQAGVQQQPSKTKRTKLLPWYVVEVGPTVLLVAAAIKLVW